MAAKPEVVAYLQENIKKFREEQLREQLFKEGISDLDFDEALKTAKERPANKKSGLGGKILLAGGLAALVVAALVSISHKSTDEPPKPSSPSAASVPESGYIGHSGYVVHLPKGYVAVQSFKDQRKTVELVHFCKAGTDPTQFLNEGLYGQLGIVRLRAEQSGFANDLDGLAALTREVTGRAAARGEKFTVKNIQISSLRGIQVNYDMPFSRVEAFILGDKTLCFFTAGQEDETYRDILNSLRDANSET